MKNFSIFVVAVVLSQVANASTFIVDLKDKSFSYDEPMALGAQEIIVIQGISNSTPQGLMLYLSDRAKNPMAIATNLTAYGTNGTAATGILSLTTTNLLGAFAGRPAQAELSLDLTMWDSVRDLMLGSAPVSVRNNPLAEQVVLGWTNIPDAVVSEMQTAIFGILGVATNAEAVAYTAYNLVSQATTGNVDMVARAGVANNALAIAAIEPDSSGWSAFAATQDVTISAAPFADGQYSYGLFFRGGTNANQFRAYGTNLYLNGQRITTIADINTNYLPLAGGELGGTLSMAVSPVADGRYSRMIQFKGGPFTNSLFAYGENLFVASGSGPLKRLFYWTDLASITSDVVVASSTRLKKTVGAVDKDYPVAVVAGGVTNFADESGMINLGEIAGSGSGFPLTNSANFNSNGAYNISYLHLVGTTNTIQSDGTNLTYGGKAIAGTGSDFPLTNNGNLAQLSLTNGLNMQATNGIFRTVNATTVNAGSATVSGNLNVIGNLNVEGAATNFQWVTVSYLTNVYMGYQTNYITTNIYSTQTVYQTTIIETNTVITTTNTVKTYVNVGGDFTMGSNSTFDATNANVVKFPGLVSTNTSTGAVTRVTGIFDASDAAVVGIDGTTNILEMGAGSSDTNKVLRPTGSGNAVGWFDPAPGGIAEESDPVWASFLANNFTSSVDAPVESVAVTGAVTSLNGLDGGVSISVAGGSVTADGQTITIDVRSASAPPYTYAVATNIQLVCNNVAWNQQITNAESALTGPMTLVPPTNAPLENDVTIWLRIPRTTNSVTIVTAGVAEVRGSIPVFSTNNWTDTLWTKRAGTNFYQVQRLY